MFIIFFLFFVTFSISAEVKCEVDETGNCIDIPTQIKILAEKYREYTRDLLVEEVKIPGISLQEKEVALLFKKQMEEAGFDEVFIDGLGNVIGRIGNGPKSVVFDGHIDTVDVGNLKNWELCQPHEGKIVEIDGKEYVCGRGSADQRGGVAASIAAGRILKELGFEEDLTVYVVGSVIEEDSDGLCWLYIIEELGIKPDFFVSTEATETKIYRGQRGRMEIEVEFYGVSCHASAPPRGKNAIYMASKFAVEVEKLNERLVDEEGFLGKGTVAVTEFTSGSPSQCAVSDYVKLHLDRRLTTGETKETAVQEIQDIIDDLRKTVDWDREPNVYVCDYNEVAYTGLKYGMEKYYPTWVTDEDHEIVTKAKTAYNSLFGKDPEVSRWVFSTNCVTSSGIHGVPCIGFGPGREDEAHAPNEKMLVDDLVTSSMFYAQYAYTLAKKE